MTLLLEDRALLDGFRRGEEDALARVYDAYSDTVARALATGRLFEGGRHPRLTALDIEAAHQEAFIRAFRPEARAAYDGLRPYGPYLVAIARSTAISLLRSNGKLANEWISIEDTSGLTHLPAEEPDPEEHAMRAQVRNVVGDFLVGLGERDRQLAQIRFVEGRSQEGTAAELQLTRAEVRTREGRLRRALTRFLSSSGWLEKGRPLL